MGHPLENNQNHSISHKNNQNLSKEKSIPFLTKMES